MKLQCVVGESLSLIQLAGEDVTEENGATQKEVGGDLLFTDAQRQTISNFSVTFCKNQHGERCKQLTGNEV